MINFNKFSENLSILINSSGKTAKDVALDMGISATAISRYLRNLRKPDLEIAFLISQYFNVSIDWLFGLAEDRHSDLSPEMKELLHLYSLASTNDRLVINTLLSKYKGE